MNKFATIEQAIWFRKITFYSVKFEDEASSLFLQFVNSHSNEVYSGQLSLIRSWLTKLGNEIGADEVYFRYEGVSGGEAVALPPPARFLNLECKLRLYCMRVNRNAVILFSGAEKTANTAQACKNVRLHFFLANKLTKVISIAIKNKDIIIDPKNGRLIFDDDLIFEIS